MVGKVAAIGGRDNVGEALTLRNVFRAATAGLLAAAGADGAVGTLAGAAGAELVDTVDPEVLEVAAPLEPAADVDPDWVDVPAA
jgi:hypothetical protein